MGIQIPNSNPFIGGDGAFTYNSSEFTFWTPGSNLPDTQTDSIPSEQPLRVNLALRRNQFDEENWPEGFIPANQILDLAYKKQIKYVKSLDEDKLISWYGASDEDIEAVLDYITQFGATDIITEKETRAVSFVITYEQFKNAFLNDRPEMLTDVSGGIVYSYNPSDYASSYLTASGNGAQEFASTIIGISAGIITESSEESRTQAQTGSNSRDNQVREPEGIYYPTEVAKLYDFPSPKKTGAGKGVTIGIVGIGANQFELFNQGNAFNRYLKAQKINIRKLGKVDSPNDEGDPDAYWTELGIDYSILRSIAPRANLIISENNLFGIAELVYNDDVDIISSSAIVGPFPGEINLNEAFHELFIDAVLRGKSVVQAAGDQGTGNYEAALLPNGRPYADFSGGDPAILSVGGTAIGLTTKLKRQQKPNLKQQTSIPLPHQGSIRDEVTGLINNQLMWNDYSSSQLSAFKEDELEVYPSFQDQFSVRDFKGATILPDVFYNASSSSGIFSPAAQPMPGYQQKNLERRWQGTGRLYPDVSVLAGGNNANEVESSYYVIDLQNGKPVLTPAGGTSAGAPLLAGLLANITSGLRKKFGKDAKIGLVNPYLYEQYNSKRGKDLLIDVPKGSNNASTFNIANSPDEWLGKYAGILVEPGTNNEYLVPLNGTGPNGTLDLNLSSTGKGFDAASGLGSINGQALFDGLMQVWSSI